MKFLRRTLEEHAWQQKKKGSWIAQARYHLYVEKKIIFCSLLHANISAAKVGSNRVLDLRFSLILVLANKYQKNMYTFCAQRL